jgi:hypothetical protein
MVREISAPYKDQNSDSGMTYNTPLLASNASVGSAIDAPQQLPTTRGVTPGAVARQSRRKSVL